MRDVGPRRQPAASQPSGTGGRRRAGTQPRRLTSAEAAALRARPWPALPWWLWAAVALSVVAAAVVAVALLRRATPERITVPLGARRSPPAAGRTHDVGAARASALEPSATGRFTSVDAGCPRLAGVRLAGTPAEVETLRAAAGKLCALRSVGGIDQARTALRGAHAVVAFAAFERTGNESTALLAPQAGLALGQARAAVLVNRKFAGAVPERTAVLLAHEGAHLQPPGDRDVPVTAAQELAARRVELAACDQLFHGRGGPEPNRGCSDARELLALGEARALAALRAAGYR
ncbi:MAG TPA: hypothetical protein VKG45_04640 [Actinomycetes bacterium]|nr:hypothetical protein [Actinomycetes bacterium]